MHWKEALNENHGDYAYSEDGGMILRDGTSYTVRSGDLNAACAGNWSKVERSDMDEVDIPKALAQLGMQECGWSAV